MANATITNTQIASATVTDANLQYGKVSNRQGGSATDWDVNGTSNYVPSAVKIQVGTIMVGSGTNSTAVTFPVAFSAYPAIFLTSQYGTGASKLFTTTGTGNSGFTIQTFDGSNVTANVSVRWLAIGTP